MQLGRLELCGVLHTALSPTGECFPQVASVLSDDVVHMYRALHIPPGDLAQEDSAIAHFHDKLLHIRERLKTEPGRKMGEKRHKLVGANF